VGGGIGGLTAAAALHRLGAEVRVVEQAPAFDPIGAGITIQANATAVLRALGIELPPEDVVPIGDVQLVDAQGRALGGADPASIQLDPPSVNIHRAELHRALLAACRGIDPETNRSVTAVEADPDGVDVSFADGSEDRFELLIGADGFHSVVRRTVVGDPDPVRYSGQTCWRFACDAPNGVPKVTVEHWVSRRRAGVVPLAHDRVYVYLVESAPRGTPGPGSASPEAIRARFGGISPTLDAVLGSLGSDTVIHHGDLEDRPDVHFGAGRVVLLGDAAHPMTPNTGQGAGTAIEDAGALALLLPEHASRLDTLVPALEALRRRRVTTVRDLSWRIGQVAHWQNRVACAVRNTLLRAVPASTAARQAQQLWAPGLELAARIVAERKRATAA
jgi:2-polyprenyl-6-methoxyphenol hydroxylase-like FAD-dependent oxidoreductase